MYYKQISISQEEEDALWKGSAVLGEESSLEDLDKQFNDLLKDDLKYAAKAKRIAQILFPRIKDSLQQHLTQNNFYKINIDVLDKILRASPPLVKKLIKTLLEQEHRYILKVNDFVLEIKLRGQNPYQKQLLFGFLKKSLEYLHFAKGTITIQ